MSSVVATGLKSGNKPDLLSIIHGFEGEVNDAVFVTGQNSILTASEDRSLRLWVMRDSGRYWPSVEKILPSPASLLVFDSLSRRICSGLDNGTISDFKLSDDLNCLNHTRDILAHLGRITGIICVRELKLLLSTSRDKTVAWFNDATGEQLGSYNLDAPGTCLQFHVDSNCLFVGDSTGRITLLGLAKGRDPPTFELIRQLHGHTGSVTSMSWDSLSSRLLSASIDQAVIMWDIGGGKGSAYELQGHSKAVSSVEWWYRPILQKTTAVSDDSASRSPPVGRTHTTLTVSAGLDGLVFFWFMDARRQETPTWGEADLCQLCSTPFFWNVRKMWTDKAVGVRQHHCRRCGKAVCEKCSSHRSVYPVMGFERLVRICNDCFKAIANEDLKSLASSFDARHPISRIRILGDANLLLTIGKNKEVKVWDLKSFL
uniref:WD repeat and FYVE domain-containing protein 2 n=1 Tax=Schistocephalus solidus TaxID=70667 RepID=A0A0X3PB18_SCHSO